MKISSAFESYLWLCFFAVAAVTIVWVVHDSTADNRLQMTMFSGVSMSTTIPNGSIAFWERFKQPPGNLAVGDIGCYNEPVAAASLNRSEYILCHHTVGKAQDVDGTPYFVMRTDPMDCHVSYFGIGVPEMACTTYDSKAYYGDVAGRIVFWAPFTGLAGALFLIVFLGWKAYEWEWEKRNKPKGSFPLRPMPAVPNLQHPGAGSGSGVAESRLRGRTEEEGDGVRVPSAG